MTEVSERKEPTAVGSSVLLGEKPKQHAEISCCKAGVINWLRISSGLEMAARNGTPTKFDMPTYCPWCGKRMDCGELPSDKDAEPAMVRMFDKLAAENSKMKKIIEGACVQFYRDGQTDGECAANMLRILSELKTLSSAISPNSVLDRNPAKPK